VARVFVLPFVAAGLLGTVTLASLGKSNEGSSCQSSFARIQNFARNIANGEMISPVNPGHTLPHWPLQGRQPQQAKAWEPAPRAAHCLQVGKKGAAAAAAQLPGD
jgi:hypothetical protein